MWRRYSRPKASSLSAEDGRLSEGVTPVGRSLGSIPPHTHTSTRVKSWLHRGGGAAKLAVKEALSPFILSTLLGIIVGCIAPVQVWT